MAFVRYRLSRGSRAWSHRYYLVTNSLLEVKLRAVIPGIDFLQEVLLPSELFPVQLRFVTHKFILEPSELQAALIVYKLKSRPSCDCKDTVSDPDHLAHLVVDLGENGVEAVIVSTQQEARVDWRQKHVLRAWILGNTYAI